MKKREVTGDNVIPMRKKRKKTAQKQQMGMCIAAVLLLLGLMIYLVTQCQIKTLVITGNETYTQDEVEAAIRNKAVNNTVFYTVAAWFSKNDYLPFIEKSEVTYLGKNVLKVEVHEKLRAGVLKEMSEYFYFDKDGIVREESQARLRDVPLVTGLKMDNCVLNEQIKPREEGVFPIILKITQLIIKYEIPIQEIQFNTLTDIRLTTSTLTIKFGTSSELDAKMAELPSILKELSNRRGTLNMESYQEENKIITFTETKTKTSKKKK